MYKIGPQTHRIGLQQAAIASGTIFKTSRISKNREGLELQQNPHAALKNLPN
jgi:hypothetical protein